MDLKKEEINKVKKDCELQIQKEKETGKGIEK